MTVRLTASAGNQYYSAPDSPALTIAGDFTLSFVLNFDGVTTTATPQYVVSTGALADAGSFHAVYQPNGASANNNRLTLYRNGSSTPFLTSTGLIAGGQSWLYAISRSGTSLTVRRCPILSAEPTTGASVVADGSAVASEVFDTAKGVFIGSRGDLVTNRLFDNSLGRVFYIDAVLTDLEVAQLAYGKEITQIGRTPIWYARLDTADDFNTRGSSDVTFSKSGAPTTSPTQPAFGFAPAPAAPVISGTPTINTSPIVGSPVGYTAASVTGTSTRTQQWSIDGVDIASATANTYTPLAGDAGKALRVRQVETNASAPSGVSATSAPATVTAVTADAVAGTAMPAERIYQRSGSGLAIAMSGTYSGTLPTSIEYQLYAEDGTTVLKPWVAVTGATIGSGAWSGTPSVPQGGMYRRQVRTKNGTSVIATGPVETELFGVGDLFAVVGSSSAAKRFDSTSGSGFTPRADVRAYRSGAWVKFGTQGCAIAEANGFSAQSGVPVGMLDLGVGGTTLTNWLTTTSSYWTSFKETVTAVGGKLAGAMSFIGSNDAANGTVVSRASHANNLRVFFENIRGYTAQPNLPILASGFNRRTTAELTDEQANFVRMAENDVGDDANVTHVQTLDFGMHASDGTHLTSGPTGFPASATRNVYVWGRRMYGDGVYARGPRITEISVSGLTGTATIVHRSGSDYTPTSDITGFAAADVDGAAVTVTASRAGATTIALTFSAAPVKVTYLAGKAPLAGTQLFDNGTQPLPMAVETDMALNSQSVEPAPDTTAPVLEGTVTASNVGTTTATITIPLATDNTAVAGYEYSTNGGTSYVNNGTSRTANLAGLTPETSYPLRARAYDAAGNRSAAITGTLVTAAAVVTPPPDTTVPTITGTVAAANVTSTTAMISWPAGADNVAVAGYEYSVNGGTSYINSGTARTASLSGLTPETTYFTRARVLDTATPPNKSTPISGSFTTLAAAVTPPPNTGFTPSVSRTVRILAGRNAYDTGSFWTVNAATGPVGSKDPQSTIDIPFDWTNWLADIGGASLSAVDFILSAGLVSAAGIPSAVGGTLFVSGGVVGTNYSITCRITTATTPLRIEERTVVLQVKEQ